MYRTGALKFGSKHDVFKWSTLKFGDDNKVFNVMQAMDRSSHNDKMTGRYCVYIPVQEGRYLSVQRVPKTCENNKLRLNIDSLTNT